MLLHTTGFQIAIRKQMHRLEQIMASSPAELPADTASSQAALMPWLIISPVMRDAALVLLRWSLAQRERCGKRPIRAGCATSSTPRSPRGGRSWSTTARPAGSKDTHTHTPPSPPHCPLPALLLTPDRPVVPVAEALSTLATPTMSASRREHRCALSCNARARACVPWPDRTRSAQDRRYGCGPPRLRASNAMREARASDSVSRNAPPRRTADSRHATTYGTVLPPGRRWRPGGGAQQGSFLFTGGCSCTTS